MIEKRNWKSTVLLVSISTLGFLLLGVALISTVKLPFLTNAGLLSWLVLLVLTLAASRFTVSISNSVGVSQSRKSVADAFVFLAVILYAVPPADTPGPATLLAAIVGFVSTCGLASRKESISSNRSTSKFPEGWIDGRDTGCGFSLETDVGTAGLAYRSPATQGTD